MLVIAVTGASGSGKTHFAKMLSRRLGRRADIIEINDIVNRHRTYSGTDKFNTKIVDLGRLNSAVKNEMREDKAVILVGHLAPELRLKYDIAVVTRCGPKLIAKRLERRRYPLEKLRDNIIAEATDYCGVKIEKKSKEIYEVETELEKRGVMNYVADRIAGKKARKPRSKMKRKLDELLELASKENKYGI